MVKNYSMSEKPLKKVAIVQSNYIPWKGYFDLINLVDEFILFDDMQYTRRDWRNRNIIKTFNGLLWLTIPVGRHRSRGLDLFEEAAKGENSAMTKANDSSHGLNRSSVGFRERRFEVGGPILRRKCGRTPIDTAGQEAGEDEDCARTQNQFTGRRVL